MRGLFIALLLLSQVLRVHAAATLLPNGEQCFSATAPTSGGLYGPILTSSIAFGGLSYVNGSYTNVPLTGGSGFGAQASIVVTSGSVSSVVITNPGSHYAPSDVLGVNNSSLGGSGSGFVLIVNSISGTGTGFVGLLGTITGGSGGTAGTYGGVALTGGSGTGATANITVSGGAVTAVTIVNPGTGYQVADTLSALSASIGGVTGFSVPVSSVAINQALAGGSVAFYVPGTNTFKQTWQNSAQTILNTNPVTLDQNGCATIYGAGSYRQVLQDASGNVVWDKITTDTSAQQNIFWAGNAAGTPNAITLTDAGFNGTDGSIIDFFPVFTNTGATTISIASTAFTNIPVMKDTTGGAVALTGGEIVQGGQANVVSVLYSAVQNNFHLLNTAIASASGANTPFCGATGLKITNSSAPGSAPNQIVTITANQIVMQTASGLIINRSGVNLTNINITTGLGTSIANGMDGESPGTNNWLYIWAIDNGAAPAGLVSSAAGNGFAPTLPSGYTYKCRLGVMRADGAGNLLRTLQLGTEAQYVVTPSTTTADLPLLAQSANTNITFPTAVSVTAAAPPTTTKVTTRVSGFAVGATNQSLVLSVSPNNNYAVGGTAIPICSYNEQTATGASQQFANTYECAMLLESTNIFWGVTYGVSNASNSSEINMLGWRDNVNAN